MSRILRVALDVPLAKCFDYVADGVAPVPGSRVIVPLGRRTAVGVVVEPATRSDLPPEQLKAVIQVPDSVPLLSPEDLRLLRFASDYYHYPIGQVILNAIPQPLRRAKPPIFWERSEYALTPAGEDTQLERLPLRAHAKRRLLQEFQLRRAIPASELKGRVTREALKHFQAQGWVELRRSSTQHEPTGMPTSTLDRQPTNAQSHAINTICETVDRYRAYLLRGVTGSGKTEVYLRVAQHVLERGSQVLFLVPEIALTPQLQSTIAQRFPAVPLVTLHSGLSEGERMRAWLAAHSGTARVVLGTRLAVFAPLPKLGLIIVDEEHDPSLKQSEGFCYSARDLAVVRASQRGVPVVLGSATPALESYHNARSGRYTLLELNERINAPPPRVSCIRVSADAEDGLTPQLLDAVATRIARKEQTLVFINRRGYAPVVMCHSCGWLSGCDRCSAQLVLHLPQRELHCHHCGYHSRVPPACPQCGNPGLSPVGQGTQRVEAALVRRFPSARILRIDSDSTRRKDAWAHMRDRIQDHDVDILVGTQILAKGHDFPHLALVGVLNPDSMLYSSDFRAAERLYALLTQVAGRAGRRELRGEVLIQTEFPDHPLYAALCDEDTRHFPDQLLEERRRAGFPPFVHQALLRAEAPKIETAIAFLEQAKEIGRALGNVELCDPVPAAMMRLAGRERAQLLVQASSRAALHGFLTPWRDMLSSERVSGARWLLEVDPAEL